jgi:hypothetical protein
MSEFIDANLPALIERGVPPKLASKALSIWTPRTVGSCPVHSKVKT